MTRKPVLALYFALGLAGCNHETRTSVKPDVGPTTAVSGSAQAIAPTTRDGPFGLAMGEPLNGLDLSTNDKGDESGVRLLASVPKPNSDFDRYAAVGFTSTGLCEVRAITPDFDGDEHGVRAMSVADTLAEPLQAKYGKFRKEDGCSEYSCNSEFWTMKIKEGGRWYSYHWKDTAALRAAHLSSIDLHVEANDITTPYVRLDYTFDNKAACKAALNGSKASSL